MTYWDTSALVRLYVAEADSADYLGLISRQPDIAATGFLTQIEIYYAFLRKEIDDEIGNGLALRYFTTFQRDLDLGRFHFIAWTPGVVAQTHRILGLSFRRNPPIYLRSLDGIHLGSARTEGLTKIVSADTRMRDAARAAGLTVITP